ncbi:MAG: GTPase Era [Deltaproteobacteria bacterium]|nr:GTPase Era [Deltaproteobacteria bacterium]
MNGRSGDRSGSSKILPCEEPPLFRSGFIGIIGKPNAGKSTLMNCMVGEKVAISTHKPQTTRNRIMGIRTTERCQCIFLDTPGIHAAKTAFNRQLVSTAMSVFDDVNLLLLISDAGTPIGEDDTLVVSSLKDVEVPVVLVINKTDLIPKEKLLPLIDKVRKLYSFEEIVPVSALKGFNVDRLLGVIEKILPEGPPYFPDDMITDRSERFLAAEMIREQITLLTHREVPYATAVVIDSFKEDAQKRLLRLQATIHVEKDSQKGIIIGRRGSMLKKIGTGARLEMERFFNTKVYLELFVRVQRDWARDSKMLGEIGFPND